MYCGLIMKANTSFFYDRINHLILPTGSEERGVLRVGSIHVVILPSCQDVKTIALRLHKHVYSWVVKI